MGAAGPRRRPAAPAGGLLGQRGRPSRRGGGSGGCTEGRGQGGRGRGRRPRPKTQAGRTNSRGRRGAPPPRPCAPLSAWARCCGAAGVGGRRGGEGTPGVRPGGGAAVAPGAVGAMPLDEGSASTVCAKRGMPGRDEKREKGGRQGGDKCGLRAGPAVPPRARAGRRACRAGLKRGACLRRGRRRGRGRGGAACRELYSRGPGKGYKVERGRYNWRRRAPGPFEAVARAQKRDMVM